MADSERGTLEVRSRAVGRMAEIAASSVTGVERVRGGVTARSLPHVDATVQSGKIRATVEAATRWPTPIADVAIRVRAAVEQDLASNSGLEVHSVDVRMHYSNTSVRSRRVE